MYLDSRTLTGWLKPIPLASTSRRFSPCHCPVPSDCLIETLSLGQSCLKSLSGIGFPVAAILSSCACAAAVHCCLTSWTRLKREKPLSEKVNARIKIPRTAIETIISIKRKPLYFTFVADNFNSPKSRQGVIAPDKLLIIEIPGEKIARTTKPTTIPMQRMIHGQMMNLARLTL